MNNGVARKAFSLRGTTSPGLFLPVRSAYPDRSLSFLKLSSLSRIGLPAMFVPTVFTRNANAMECCNEQ